MLRRSYTFLLYLSLPLVLLRLLWRSIRAPAYRRRWGERFGRFAPPAEGGGLWIHAVSVGEAQAAAPLIRQLLDEHPSLPLVVTTTTPTGSERVRSLFPERVFHVYLPYDIPFALNGFLCRVRPRMLVMMETEVWPNLLAHCHNAGITTILANARMSAGSARGYARFGRFARETFARITLVAAQSEADAGRFSVLGVADSAVVVTGSIKFDIRIPASLRERSEAVRRAWGDRPVWLAASTHEGEDEQILEAHHRLLQWDPRVLLVLVPRHPERFERVAQLCQRLGFEIARRSLAEAVSAQTQVFLGDTMGELTLFIGASDLAFVGGSLVPVGGHNLLEPAAFGVPVLIGPHMFNFAEISRMMLTAGAAVQIESSTQLSTRAREWLENASLRAEAGECGRTLVARNRGALERLYALIEQRL
ncbi:MAG: lipid IV(A) 3-deoxy-D-manno-octulosonic acid transferase [Gammaproteobacteria bacterium]|nr:lipid IV(A) 3-deoxy-D-manno-octulosonic acid transferase [Gammaproteobacteria bacterium]